MHRARDKCYKLWKSFQLSFFGKSENLFNCDSLVIEKFNFYDYWRRNENETLIKYD